MRAIDVGAERREILQSGAGGTDMSMMGRFVQVSPDRLKQILDDPSDVEELFASEQVAQGVTRLMGGTLALALQNRAPKLLATTMARMDPAMRERVANA